MLIGMFGVFFLAGCSSEDIPISIESESDYLNQILPTPAEEFHSSLVPDIPEMIIFAGDTVRFDDWDLRERLDKELIVNMHWHSNMLFYLKRANRWFPMMREILREESVPEDFLYLAVIESGLVQATSPSGAKGFWQFMEGTAKDYGLIVNAHVDERLHVEKSTRAACQYLKKSYKKFGSWFLAAAAYNRGAGGIQSDRELQYMEDFFDLHLNQETSRYVFRILAVKLIFENPRLYGFEITEEQLYKPYHRKSVQVSESITDLPLWAVEQGWNYKILKLLNPWLIRKDLVVANNQHFHVFLPADTEQLKVFGGYSLNDN